MLIGPLVALVFCTVARAQTDYPPAHWDPPSGCNKYYNTGNGHQFFVHHDIESYYLVSVSYLNRCDVKTNVQFNVAASVSFQVNGLKHGVDEDGHNGDDNPDAAPGDITQSVRESKYAW